VRLPYTKVRMLERFQRAEFLGFPDKTTVPPVLPVAATDTD